MNLTDPLRFSRGVPVPDGWTPAAHAARQAFIYAGAEPGGANAWNAAAAAARAAAPDPTECEHSTVEVHGPSTTALCLTCHQDVSIAWLAERAGVQ